MQNTEPTKLPTDSENSSNSSNEPQPTVGVEASSATSLATPADSGAGDEDPMVEVNEASFQMWLDYSASLGYRAHHDEAYGTATVFAPDKPIIAARRIPDGGANYRFYIHRDYIPVPVKEPAPALELQDGMIPVSREQYSTFRANVSGADFSIGHDGLDEEIKKIATGEVVSTAVVTVDPATGATEHKFFITVGALASIGFDYLAKIAEQETQEQVGHINMHATPDSSLLQAFGYDAGRQWFFVVWKKGQEGAYTGVPMDVAVEAAKAHVGQHPDGLSIGEFVSRHIKPHFPYVLREDLEADEAAQSPKPVIH